MSDVKLKSNTQKQHFVRQNQRKQAIKKKTMIQQPSGNQVNESVFFRKLVLYLLFCFTTYCVFLGLILNFDDVSSIQVFER